MKEENFSRFDEIIKLCSELSESFRCYDDAFTYVLEKRAYINRAKVVTDNYLKHIDNGVFSDLVNVNLFPYQREGVCFAATRGRCVIADDMGLGKTVQAIAATELLRKEFGITSTFILCPTSLKYQWKTEIEKFTGQKAWVIEGNYLKRLEQYKNDSFYKIISYNTAVNDIKDINALSPDLLILDEAQRIKNFKTKISQNVKRLKSSYAFVLTGTPLENKLEELYSIVQFINPFVLGPFWKFLDEHRIIDTKGKTVGYKDLNRIGEMLADTMIRRRKKDVLLQMPERMDKILYLPMTDQQAEIHEEYKEAVARLILKWQRQGFLNEKDRQALMIFLNMMRMVCDSTYILDQSTRFDTKIGELMNILDEVFNEGEEKVVVFSQWERMTRLVAAELDARGVKYQYLHGGVPSADRGKLFEGFTNDPDCKVFLSTDAGGVGLNLQAASILINLDIPWNPAVLEQRIARIYRLGQKRNVSIINMVSADTIEHKMLGLISFKKGLAEGILDQGDNTVFLEESKFKMFMNTIQEVVKTEGVPMAMPQNPEEAEETVLEPKLADETNNEAKNEVEIPGTDFYKDNESENNGEEASKQTGGSGSPEELVRLGMSFFNSLANTLSNPESTKKLLNSLVQKDEKDGKTYLKIPVENEKLVENSIALLSGIFSQLKK